MAPVLQTRCQNTKTLVARTLADIWRKSRAVDAALKALNTMSWKSNRLAPVLVYFGGAVVGDKECLMWSMADEFLDRVSSDATLTSTGLQDECASKLRLSMDDVGNVESDMEKLCDKPCPVRVVVVEGIAEATIERVEQLLTRIMPDDGAAVCAKHLSLSLSKWIFLLVSGLGHELLECPARPPANQTELDIETAVKKAVRDSATLEALYGSKRATKSKLWKYGTQFTCLSSTKVQILTTEELSAGLKSIVPFKCQVEGQADSSDCAGVCFCLCVCSFPRHSTHTKTARTSVCVREKKHTHNARVGSQSVRAHHACDTNT
jgi:hypothetical protein